MVQQPATGDQRPATSDQLPATSYQQSATSNPSRWLDDIGETGGVGCSSTGVLKSTCLELVGRFVARLFWVSLGSQREPFSPRLGSIAPTQ